MSLMFYLRKAAPLSHKSPRTALFCFTPRWARPSALASPAAKALNLCSACPLWSGQTSIWRKLWSGVTHTLSEGEAQGGSHDVSFMLYPINSLFCEYIKANWGLVLLCSDGMAFRELFERTKYFTGDAGPVVTLMTQLASDGSTIVFAVVFVFNLLVFFGQVLVRHCHTCCCERIAARTAVAHHLLRINHPVDSAVLIHMANIS